MKLTLNGAAVDVKAHPMKRLLDVLREELELTGTKEGCGEGECGACTVLIDGAPVCACLIPFAQVEGTSVTTIEGLGEDHPLQHAFMDEVGAQCGICTPGMILSAIALGDKPSLAQIKEGLAGNLCRCTGYEAIYRAIAKANVGKKSGTRLSTLGVKNRRATDKRKPARPSGARKRPK